MVCTGSCRWFPLQPVFTGFLERIWATKAKYGARKRRPELAKFDASCNRLCSTCSSSPYSCKYCCIRIVAALAADVGSTEVSSRSLHDFGNTTHHTTHSRSILRSPFLQVCLSLSLSYSHTLSLSRAHTHTLSFLRSTAVRAASFSCHTMIVYSTLWFLPTDIFCFWQNRSLPFTLSPSTFNNAAC